MRAWLLMVLLVWPCASQAQITQYFRVHSGTGFFVNREFIITNAHVVEHCEREAIITGAVPEQKVEVRKRDQQHDLALLYKGNGQDPPQIAPLRMDIDTLKTNDRVLVVGYPGRDGATQGRLRAVSGVVKRMELNQYGNPWQFFISDVVAHGNSGGPVLDESGNVIGVVVATAELNTVMEDTGEIVRRDKMGVAITLKALQQFLFNNGVFSRIGGKSVAYADGTLEDRAKDYIVSVQCRVPVNGLPEGEAPR